MPAGMKLFTILAVALAAPAFAAAAPAGEKYNCTTLNTHTLKWLRGYNKTAPHGYLSFSNKKDDQGRPMATALETDGSPAKPVKFHFQTCALPSGKPGYMGNHNYSTPSEYHMGHVQLAKDPTKCLTFTAIKGKAIHLVLDQCRYENSQVQEMQFFDISGEMHQLYARFPDSEKRIHHFDYWILREGAQPLIIDDYNNDEGPVHVDDAPYTLYWIPMSS